MATSILSPATGAQDREAGFGSRFIAALPTGSMLNPVNSSIVAIVLVSIGHAFGVGAASTTWLVSAARAVCLIGVTFSASLISLTFGQWGMEADPRRFSLILTAAPAILLITTTFDRSLHHGVRDRK